MGNKLHRLILTDSEKSFTYSVWDEVKKKTFDEIYQELIDQGYDHTGAYSKACGDYRDQDFHPSRKLHQVTDEELKAMPRGVKDKPEGTGKFYWRAPAFQSLIATEFDWTEYAGLILGCLEEGDRLPIKLKPAQIGHTMEYLTFVKYKHTFPTNRNCVHGETLTFLDGAGKKKTFKAMPMYSKSNDELVRQVGDVLSFWSGCRWCNEDPLFLDLFKILQREKTLYYDVEEGFLNWNKSGTKHYFDEPKNRLFCL